MKNMPEKAHSVKTERFSRSLRVANFIGDVHQLIGQDRDEQAHLVAREGASPDQGREVSDE